VLLQQGQDAEAKQRLSKALKLAHGPLASHQLVAQVCEPGTRSPALLPCRARWPQRMSASTGSTPALRYECFFVGPHHPDGARSLLRPSHDIA